jgi:diacylglycerol kinase (ATP)
MMEGSKKFSFAERVRSFRYAIGGNRKDMGSWHNAILHLAATLAVLILSLLLKVSLAEAAALTLAIGFVWVAEMFNTCVEKIMDFISLERDPRIQFIKDVSAGAVLVGSVTAFIIGLFIFIPKFL